MRTMNADATPNRLQATGAWLPLFDAVLHVTSWHGDRMVPDAISSGDLLMPEGDGLTERGRALEDDYFRKRDRELIEKIRLAAAADQVRQDLSRRTGLSDPELLKDLQELGFAPETVSLLPLVPVVQMAWAEGGVSKAERDLIVDLARRRGIEAGSIADQQLTTWLSTRPADAVFARAGRLIRAMLESDAAPSGLSAEDLVKYCEGIAAASGGILGIGRISVEERALLARIAEELNARRA